MSENGENYSAGKNFTLPPALTAWTNSTSEKDKQKENNIGEKDNCKGNNIGEKDNRV